MKKKISLLLVFVMLVSMLTACTNSGNSTSTSYDVSKAKEYVKSLYKKTDGAEKLTDYELVGNVKINSVDYKVEWTVDVKKGNKEDVKIVPNGTKVTIDINEKAAEACSYTLTATITAPDGSKETYELSHSVPAYKQFSWADYVKAAAGDAVVVTGVVTGLISKTNGASSNCVYFQDKEGGYYAYQTMLDPVADLKLQAGYTITVSGTKDIYSGTHEIKSGVVEITDTTTKVPAATDYTAIYTSAADLKDSKLVEKQALLVTIKGVEITGQGSDATYFNFKLADKESYVRLSSSTCPLTKDEQATLTANYLANIGNKCDVTGLITLYSGAFYLTPVSVDAFSNFQTVEKTDAEKVAYEAANLGIPTKVQEDKTIDLAATGSVYKDVTITYAVEGATVTDGKLALVQGDNDATVKVTATIKSGSETKEVVVEIKVEAKPSDMTVAEVIEKAFALAEGETMAGTHVLRGTITKMDDINTKYNSRNVWIQVGDKEIEAYSMVGEGLDALAVGDEITVTGTIKNYKGTVEFDKNCTFSKTLTVEEAKQLVVVDKAFALAEGETMAGTQVLRGAITKMDDINTKYNSRNVWIQVGDKEIEAYSMVGEGLDALAVGDVITITGTIKNYKGTVEFDKNCTFSKTLSIEEAKQLVIVNKAFALAEGESMTGKQTLTGTITKMDDINTKYNSRNVWIQVGDKEIEAYSMVGEGLDALAVGDKITVTGTIKNYKGTVEFDKSCTFTK